MAQHEYFVIPDPNPDNDALREEWDKAGEHVVHFNQNNSFASLSQDDREMVQVIANRFLEGDLLRSGVLDTGIGIAAFGGGYVNARFSHQLTTAQRLGDRERIVGYLDDLRTVFVPAPKVIAHHKKVRVKDVPDEDKVLSAAAVLVDARREIIDSKGALVDSTSLSNRKLLLPYAYNMRLALATMVEVSTDISTT